MLLVAQGYLRGGLGRAGREDPECWYLPGGEMFQECLVGEQQRTTKVS